MKTYVLALAIGRGPTNTLDEFVKIGEEQFSHINDAIQQCRKLNNDTWPCWVPCELIEGQAYYKDLCVNEMLSPQEPKELVRCWIEAIQVGKHRVKAYYRCKTLEEGWDFLKVNNDSCMLSMFYEPGEMQKGDGLICQTLDDLLKYIYE